MTHVEYSAIQVENEILRDKVKRLEQENKLLKQQLVTRGHDLKPLQNETV